jgi:RNA polymerase sigma factor (sigma-70 family)
MATDYARCDDRNLWALWKVGRDNRAGGALCDRHFQAVLSYFHHKVRTDRDAEDLAQRTFLELSRSSADPTEVRGYIFGVARNVLLHYIRDRRREPVDPATQSMAEVDPGPGVTTVVAKNEERLRVVTALRNLPSDDQTLLHLYYYEELSGAELAEAIGVPEPTIRGRIAAAKKRLRERLGVPKDASMSQVMRKLRASPV